MSEVRESAPAGQTDTRSNAAATSRLISASAVMAAGTMVSRILGFGRLMLLVLLFGNGTRQAEMFTLANTVPNSMYILLAGGVLNTVLVPQIVRAIKHDPDGGEAYTNRIMTAGLLVLGAITATLTLAVPWIVALYSAGGWKEPQFAAQYASMTVLAYYCMPQVFFYGVHVLAGQVLNARDRFGPMMWAPIANNVVSIGVLLLFWWVFGNTDTSGAFSSGQELLLGLGSTLGIAVQAAVLVPFLRSAGYHFRPRFDFRGTGLGKTVRLAKWTLGFVLITQVALVIINKFATSATLQGLGAGLTAYYNAYAVWILPHSLITVSLTTAMLPMASRLAATGDMRGVARETTRTMRLAMTALLPTAVGFVALGVPLTRLIFGFGEGARDAQFVGWTLIALALGLVPFTLQYICLRGFYALEDTRTPFFLQIVISTIHVVVGITALTLIDTSALVAASLAMGYSTAYSLGLLVSFSRLRRRLPDLSGRGLLRLGVRLLLAAAPAGALAFWITFAFSLWSEGPLTLALSLAVAAVVAVGFFLVLSRWLHIREVSDIALTLLRRRRPSPEIDEATPRADAIGTSRAEPGEAAVTDLAVSGDSPPPGLPGALTIDEAASAAPVATATGSSEDTDAVTQAPPAPAELAVAFPAGRVLGERYRLEELLAEAPRTITWRAFDLVLSRSVLVHLLSPEDPHAEDTLRTARRAAAATDSRFLRVLDAVAASEPDVGPYVVCEFASGQSLEAILTHGPLSGLESAWLVREVADALAGVHASGLHHERINPDTVIITHDGNVKIVGLLIEQALRPTANGGPSDFCAERAHSPEQVDVCDLGRLLYACLVGRWPGGPGFGLPEAPMQGHHLMTPRQVRAGVPPALDGICDQILNDPPRHRGERIDTAVGVVNALTKVLGQADASGDLERRLQQRVPLEDTEPTVAVPRPGQGSPLPPSRTEPSRTEPTRTEPSRTEPTRTEPTRAGAAPERRRMAAAPGTLRQPPPPVTAPTVTSPRPPRAPVPVGLVVLAVVLALSLLATGVVAAVLLDARRTPAAAPSAATSSAAPPTPSVEAPLTIAGARDFDPQGDPPEENPDDVANAIDGDPSTRWRTNWYRGSADFGRLKRGVGLVIDLGKPQEVTAVSVGLVGTGADFDVRVPANNPATTSSPPMSSDARWEVVGRESKASGTVRVDLEAPVTTRFVLVYLTSLPPDGGNRYRGGFSEVEVYS